MKNWLLRLMMVGSTFTGWSQLSDTLEVVSVYSKQDSLIKIASLYATVPHYKLSSFVLQNLGVVDIGEAIKYIPGANIKDYGGIGGLKTVNYRSLGSGHTGIEIDGINQADQQTGTIDLSSQSVFGIDVLEMSTGQVQHANAFASAYLKANMVSVSNSIATYNASEKTLVKVQSEWQSINALQNGVLVKQRLGSRLTLGGQANYRFGSGIYDYQVQNNQQVITGLRSPADLKQLQLNGAIQYHYNKLSVVILGGQSRSDQNLPGAVVFYNPKNKETLAQNKTQGAIKVAYQAKKQSFSGHGFLRSGQTTYFQDYVLNSAGFIENTYLQNHLGGGLMYRLSLGPNDQNVFLGTDYIRTELDGSQYELEPLRTAINSVLGLNKWFGKIKLEGNISHQEITDNTLETVNSFSHLSPFLSIAYVPFKNRHFRLRTFYKNSFRMPSFNDLYYRAIGNIDLLPETANLLNFGLVYTLPLKALDIEVTTDFYQNIVDNKIIAIPTKNLFNWSMQNIGKTQGRGVDISLLLTKTLPKYKLAIATNQSINQSIDITDVNGFTYGHQLPYTPVYYASYQANIQHAYFTLSANVLHSGSRFVLTENIAHNWIEGFLDIGLNVARNHKFKKGQSVTGKVQINNILDKNYQVVRSFPMPGRHLVFTFQYQFKQ